MTSLANQWILITGASSGLGRAMALEFAQAGANLILNARNAERLEQIQQHVERLGAGCLTVVGDITQDAVRESLIELALGNEIDVLANNAGIVSIESLDEIRRERIEHLIELNLKAPILLSRAVLPLFKRRRRGTFLNIVSSGGKKPVLDHATYCATKYGLYGFAEALRLEVRALGIRVLNICPGKMATQLFATADRAMDTSTFIPPEEVAKLIVSLLEMSPECSPAEVTVERMT